MWDAELLIVHFTNQRDISTQHAQGKSYKIFTLCRNSMADEQSFQCHAIRDPNSILANMTNKLTTQTFVKMLQHF